MATDTTSDCASYEILEDEEPVKCRGAVCVSNSQYAGRVGWGGLNVVMIYLISWFKIRKQEPPAERDVLEGRLISRLLFLGQCSQLASSTKSLRRVTSHQYRSPTLEQSHSYKITRPLPALVQKCDWIPRMDTTLMDIVPLPNHRLGLLFHSSIARFVRKIPINDVSPYPPQRNDRGRRYAPLNFEFFVCVQCSVIIAIITAAITKR